MISYKSSGQRFWTCKNSTTRVVRVFMLKYRKGTEEITSSFAMEMPGNRKIGTKLWGEKSKMTETIHSLQVSVIRMKNNTFQVRRECKSMTIL